MTEIEYNNPCSGYYEDDGGNEWTPCRCPICHGFLPADIYQDPLICKKCGSELLAIDHSEKFKDSDDYDGSDGKICVVTRGQKKTKQETKEERKIKRLCKEGAEREYPFL